MIQFDVKAKDGTIVNAGYDGEMFFARLPGKSEIRDTDLGIFYRQIKDAHETLAGPVCRNMARAVKLESRRLFLMQKDFAVKFKAALTNRNGARKIVKKKKKPTTK